MSDQQLACEQPTPPVKSAWLDIQCWPDEKYPTLMRLRISIELNGERFRDVIDTVFDTKPGNGIICQGTNLTWLIAKSDKLATAREALERIASNEPPEIPSILAREVLEKLRAGKEG